MHDALFGSQDQWSGTGDAIGTFKKMAGDLGVDQAQFDACLDGGPIRREGSADPRRGRPAGVSGTPAFRINGSPLSGAHPLLPSSS